MKLSEKSTEKLRVILLEIIPEIPNLVKDLESISKMRSSSGEVTFDKSIDILKEMMDMLLVRQYNRIMKILAALHEIEIEELKEKSLGEVIEMIFDTLSDESFMRFFSAVRVIGAKNVIRYIAEAEPMPLTVLFSYLEKMFKHEVVTLSLWYASSLPSNRRSKFRFV